MAIALVLLAFVVGVVLVGAYFGIAKLPGMLAQHKLETRLDEVIRPVDTDQPQAGLVKTKEEGPLPFLDRMVSSTSKGSALATWVAQSGVKISVSALLLVAAGLGVLFLFRTLGLRGSGAVVGALLYTLTPYWLEYAARLSVLLLPWAGLPWMLALLIRALRRGGWRHAAIFALLVQVIGSVNVTALVFAGVGPLLWIPYALLIERDVADAAVAARVAALQARNVPAYALAQKNNTARVYAGAFRAPGEAVRLYEDLKTAGIQTSLVYRTGRVY